MVLSAWGSVISLTGKSFDPCPFYRFHGSIRLVAVTFQSTAVFLLGIVAGFGVPRIGAGADNGFSVTETDGLISVTGAMGDESKEHNPRVGPSQIIDGVEEMRKAVRFQIREGIDNVKLDVSGDPFYPSTPGSSTPMTFAAVRAKRGRWNPVPQPMSRTVASSQVRTARMASSRRPSGSAARFSSSYTRGAFQMFGLAMAPAEITTQR